MSDQMLPLTDPSDRAVFQPRCLSPWLFCYFFAIARFSYLVSSSRLTERVSSLQSLMVAMRAFVRDCA
jgi:hypothetical protein